MRIPVPTSRTNPILPSGWEGVIITEFATAEDLQHAFEQELGIVLPRIVQGSKIFFPEMLRWAKCHTRSRPPLEKAFIPPNPTLALSYPFPKDEIAAALALAGSGDTEAQREQLMNKYHLDSALLSRPTISLSGGERLLVGFAKCDILSSVTSSLVLCSPTQWLHPSRYDCVTTLISAYISRNKPVRVLLLQGDHLPGNTGIHERTTNTSSPCLPHTKDVTWRIESNNATVVFPEQSFPHKSPEKTIRYSFPKNVIEMKSPVLCRGFNGIGKSTLAKILAGCIRLSNGHLRSSVNGFSGRARLLMQDCPDQLLGRAPLDHMDWVFQCDIAAHNTALALFEELQEFFGRFVSAGYNLGTIGDKERPYTLSQAKLTLIAERLTSCPHLIILDEPGWGLSADACHAFVATCVQAASSRGIGVLAIAHSADALSGIWRSSLSFEPDSTDPSIVKVISGDMGDDIES